MNYIQKAWLKVLTPVKIMVMDKLALRTGLVGKIARLFRIGPREYGTHPTTKLAHMINYMLLQFFQHLARSQPYFSNFFRKDVMLTRKFGTVGAIFPLLIAFGTYQAVFGITDDAEGNNTLAFLKSKLKYTPVNGLNFRKSAHYSEINSYYTHEMMELVIAKAGQILQQRDKLSPLEQQTLYARKGYIPILPHSNVPGYK